MTTTAVTLDELARDLAAVLARVEAGEMLVLTRDGAPVAELRPAPPPPPPGRRPRGLAAGMFSVPDDFDSPLPDGLAREFGAP